MRSSLLLALVSFGLWPALALAQPLLVPPGGDAPALENAVAAELAAPEAAGAGAAVASVLPPPPGLPPGKTELRLVVTGDSGGFSAWDTELRGPAELVPYLRNRPGSLAPESAGTSVYRRGGRLLFSEPPWTVREFRSFLAAGPHTWQTLCEQMPLLAGADELDFELDEVGCARTADRNSLDLFMMALGGPPRPQTGEPGAPSGVRLDWSTARLRRVTATDGRQAYVLEDLSADPTEPLAVVAEQWENRFVIRSRVRIGDDWHRLVSVGRPWNEGSRRAAYLRRMRESPWGSSLLWLDAGGAVEGPSFVDEAVNLDWPISWGLLQDLRLDALVPGANELHGGLARLQAEAEQRKVPLVSANLVKGGQPVFRRFLLLPHGDLLVGLVGLSDPESVGGLRPALLEGATVEAPAPALEAALARMREQAGRPVDLVVLVGKLGPKSWETLRTKLQGVHVVLLPRIGAEDAGWPVRSKQPSASAGAHLPPPSAPLLIRFLGRRGPEEVVVRFGARAAASVPAPIERVAVEPVAIDETWPRDEAVAEAVLKIRHDVYQQGDEVLMPDVDPLIRKDPALLALLAADPELSQGDEASDEALAAGRPAVLSTTFWTQLVASSLRRALDADVALVERQELRWRSLGPVPRVFCQANLARSSTLVRIAVPGAVLDRLLRGGLELEAPGVSGATADGSQIAGRALRADEWYRVATTEALLARPEVQDLLRRAKVDPAAAARQFRAEPGGRFVPDTDGKALTLRRAVLAVLEDRKARDPSLGDPAQTELRRDLRRGGDEKSPLLYIDIKELTAAIESYREPSVQLDSSDASPGYSQVSETRVQTRSNLRQAYRADLSLVLDSKPLTWVSRGFLLFDRYEFEGSKDETQDDLIAETELRLGFWSADLGGGATLSPAAKLTYDTEITPLQDDEGNDLDRQALLRGSLGPVLAGAGSVKMARLGLLLQRNLQTDKTEYGLVAELDHRLPLGPLAWTNAVDARWYLPKEQGDTPADLGLRVAGRSALRVPFLRDLSFLAFVDVFLFQGKTDETRDFGMSTVLGVGLSYARMWKPTRESLF